MPAPYSYAIVRIVPRVEREEFVNVGVIVYASSQKRVCVRIELKDARLRALAPEAPVADIQQQLDAFVARAHDTRISATDRFHWLVATRSTVVQTSAVHTGLCDDLDACLDKLFQEYVATPAPACD